MWLLAGLAAAVLVGLVALMWSGPAFQSLGHVSRSGAAASKVASASPGPRAIGTSGAAADPTAAATSVVAPSPKPSPAVAATVVPVLLYHHVMPNANNFIAMTPAAFERQMTYLRDSGFHPISQAQMIAFLYEARPLPDKPVMITFDDGRANQLQYAVPILKKYGFTATFFVTRKWVTGGSAAFMTGAQVRGLADQGFDVGSHSLTHMPLQNRPGESREAYSARVHDEVFVSKSFVESVTGKPCLAIAYPAGYYGNKTWLPEICKAAGYRLGYSVDGGVNHWGARPFLLRRNDTGRGSFASFLSFLGK